MEVVRLSRSTFFTIALSAMILSIGRAAAQTGFQPVPGAASAAPPAHEPAPVQSGGGLSAQGGNGMPSLGANGWISRGRTRLSVGAGWGSASNGSYALLSAGLGYFLMTGLEAGLDGEAWLGNTPQIYKVTPGLRYVFHQVGTLFPYVGAFYRRVLYTGEDPLSSLGGRGGVYMPMGRSVYTGIGVVYEHQLDCDTSVYKYCSTTYPEFTISFTF